MRYRYEIDPIDSHKTLVNQYKALGTSVLGFIILLCNLLCLAFCINTIIELFQKLNYYSFVKMGLFVIIIVLLDGLSIVFLSLNRKSAFLNLCLFLLLTVALLALILGIAQLYRAVYFGILMMLFSMVTTILCVFLGIIKYRKEQGMNPHLFKDR